MATDFPSVASQYAKARKMVATIEYQLQQLEERPRPRDGDAAATLTDDARQALAENVNRLDAEVAALERVLVEHASSTPTPQLWPR